MVETWEVEQKFIVRDVQVLLDCLQNEQFYEVRVEQHSDMYFRHPSRDFRVTDEAFRVRVFDGKACVTYKGRRLDGPVKTRPEIELGIVAQEQDQWTTMLGHLGFEPLPTVRKTRRVFKREAEQPRGQQLSGRDSCEVIVCVDDVEQLGAFAEVELLVNDRSELDWAQQQIHTMAERLSLTDAQPMSYLAQLLVKLGVE